MLFREIKDCNFITVLFEEAFYDTVQESQMDFFNPFWNINLDKVSTHYFKLLFSHTMANNIYLNFQEALRGALLPKSLQASMSIGNCMTI